MAALTMTLRRAERAIGKCSLAHATRPASAFSAAVRPMDPEGPVAGFKCGGLIAPERALVQGSCASGSAASGPASSAGAGAGAFSASMGLGRIGGPAAGWALMLTVPLSAPGGAEGQKRA